MTDGNTQVGGRCDAGWTSFCQLVTEELGKLDTPAPGLVTTARYPNGWVCLVGPLGRFNMCPSCHVFGLLSYIATTKPGIPFIAGKPQADLANKQVKAKAKFDAEVNACRSGKDGDCNWAACPQLRDGEPARSGRHCPLDSGDDSYS